MKRYLSIVFAFIIGCSVFAQEAKNEIDFSIEENKHNQTNEIYSFTVDYRLQIGYLQEWQNSKSNTYPDLRLFGPQLGVTFDFNLPYNFSVQTGILYQLSYGTNYQHWKNISIETFEEQYIKHNILSHNIAIPIRATYSVKVWKKLSLMFYTGPQLIIGLAQTDYMNTYLNEETLNWLNYNNIHTEKYDRLSSDELIRVNIQYGLGLGIQWDKYRLHGGYDFGLNNMVKQNNNINQHMWSWTWNVSLSYLF